jgi:hypothetical protein
LLAAVMCLVCSGQAIETGRERVQSQEAMPPAATLAPEAVDFGDQVAKRSSKPRRITVTNSGGKALYINSASITGENLEEFVMTADTCTGARVGPNKSCVIDVIFSPLTPGSRKAALKLMDNATDSPQTARLTGNGINSIDSPPRTADSWHNSRQKR